MNDADETLSAGSQDESPEIELRSETESPEDEHQEESSGTAFPGDDDDEDDEDDEDEDDNEEEEDEELEDEEEGSAYEPPWQKAYEQLWKLTPAEVLAQVRDFIGKYLVCSDDQRTLLALWVLHTWCYRSFTTTPYLDIRSADQGCGKTICIQVLNVLCRRPWLAAGAPLQSLSEKVLAHDFTILLDDWHTIFRPSDNQPIVGLLVRGARDYQYTDPDRHALWIPEALDAFCPKAFAG